MEAASIANTASPRRGLATRASTVLPLLGYLAALIAVETVAATEALALTALGHGVLVVAILTHAGARLERAGQARDALGRTLCGLALLPLVGLVATALAFESLPAAERVAITALAALGGVLMSARTLNLGMPELGLRSGNLPVQLGVALTGAPLALLALILGGGRAFEPLGEASTLPLVFAIVVAAPVQELVFRGILATTFGELFGRAGMVWTSVLFAVAAIATGSVGMVVALAICGLVWGWARERTGSIAGTAVAHVLVAGGLVFVPPPVLG